MNTRQAHLRPTNLDLDYDGVIEITTVEQAAALSVHLLDPDRDRPMVVVSTHLGTRWAIDAEAVYDSVTPLARVARIRGNKVAYALAEGLPAGTAVYGSAGRVYPTGTAWTADPYTSLLKVARDEHRAGLVGQGLVEAALAAGYTPTARSGCACDQTKLLNAQVRELQQHIARLEDRLARAAAPTARMPQQHVPAIADPDARFRAEVTAQWQQRVGATDPTSIRLPAEYPLDQGFLDSLARLTPSQYRKVASVAMEILTDLVRDIPGRNVHRLRTGTPGNSPDRRTSSGHFILRANVQTNRPAARRIHWTLTPDGQIALLAVTGHDQQLAA
jgi:hypothetical protein